MIPLHKKLFLIIFLLAGTILAEMQVDEEYHYVVNYLMLPSLDMKMTLSYNYDFDGGKTGKIYVTTKTKRFFNTIFEIDNHYSTVFQLTDKCCLFHQKNIHQPNVTQNLQVEYNDQKALYSNGESRTFKAARIYDFFSMLVYLRKTDHRELEKQTIIVDMEGEFFQVSFLIGGTELLSIGKEKIETRKIRLVYQKVHRDQQSVLEYTDIFFWKMAEETGEKYIWLETDKNKRIIKARFSDGRGALEAKLVDPR